MVSQSGKGVVLVAVGKKSDGSVAEVFGDTTSLIAAVECRRVSSGEEECRVSKKKYECD